MQLKLTLGSCVALPRRAPAALAFEQAHELFDAGALAQAEEILLSARFALGQQAFVTVTGVAAQQPRATFPGQRVPHAPEIFAAVRGGVFLARTHFDIENQPQSAHEERVIGVAGPARLVRIVADCGAFLLAVDRFDRDIQIQDPGQAQRGPPGLLQRGRPARPRRRARRRRRRPGARCPRNRPWSCPAPVD